MRSEGSLGSSLADVFLGLAEEGRSGVLTVEVEENDERRFLFADGRVAPAFLPVGDNEPFGEVLVFTKVLERRQLRDALATPEAQAGRPLLSILERQGLIDGTRLQEALEGYLRHRVLDLFLIARGHYDFDEGQTLRESPPFHFEAASLAEEGKQVDRLWREAVANLPPADDIVRLDLGASDTSAIPNVPESLTRLLDGTLSRDEVIARAPFPRLQTVRILEVLVEQGFLRVLTTEELRRRAEKFAGDPLGREIKFLERYVARAGEDLATHRRLADAYAAADRHQEAAAAYLEIARAAEAAGDLPQAMEAYRHAGDLDDATLDAPTALLELAIATFDEKAAVTTGDDLMDRLMARGQATEAAAIASRLDAIRMSGESGFRTLRTIGRVRQATGDVKGALSAYRKAESLLGDGADPAELFDLYQDMVDWDRVPDQILDRLSTLGLELPEVELLPVAASATGQPTAPPSAPVPTGRPATDGHRRGVRPKSKRKPKLWIGGATALVALVVVGAVGLQMSKASASREQARVASEEAARLDAAAEESGALADWRKAATAYNTAIGLYAAAGDEDEAAPLQARLAAIQGRVQKMQAQEKAALQEPIAAIEALLDEGRFDEAARRLAEVVAAAPATPPPWFPTKVAMIEERLSEAREEQTRARLEAEVAALEAALAGPEEPADVVRRARAVRTGLGEASAPAALVDRVRQVEEKATRALEEATLGAAAAATEAMEADLGRGRIDLVRKRLDGAERALAAYPGDLADDAGRARAGSIATRLGAIRGRLESLEEEAALLLATADELHGGGSLQDARAAYRRLLSDPALSSTVVAAAVALPYDVTSEPPGALVLLDGQEIGRTPATVRVPAARRRAAVVVARRGFRSREIVLDLDGPPIHEVRLEKRIAWTAEIGGRSEAPPAVSAERILVGARDGFLYAFDSRPETAGRLVYTHRESGLAEIAVAPLLLPDGRVVYGTINTGVLYCLEVGRTEAVVAWQRRFPDWFENDGVVDPTGERFYIANRDGNLYAVETRRGEPVWQTRVGRLLGPAGLADGALFVVGADRSLRRVDSASGTIRWTRPLSSTPSDGPLVVGGRVYVGVLDRKVEVFDAATGAAAGTLALPEECRTRPIAASGLVHALTVTGNWVAFDPATGREVWRIATGLDRPHSPVAGIDRGYAVGREGRVVAIDTGEGMLLWSYQTDEDVEARPAFGHGLLVVAGQRSIVAFEEGDD